MFLFSFCFSFTSWKIYPYQLYTLTDDELFNDEYFHYIYKIVSRMRISFFARTLIKMWTPKKEQSEQTVIYFLRKFQAIFFFPPFCAVVFNFHLFSNLMDLKSLNLQLALSSLHDQFSVVYGMHNMVATDFIFASLLKVPSLIM